MKIIKMYSPHTEHFDGYVRNQLNEVEVNTQLANKYMGDMQFPVPVTPEAPGGWKAFLNRHKKKFFFWITAALLTGLAVYYFTRSDADKNAAGANAGTPAQAAPGAGTAATAASGSNNEAGTKGTDETAGATAGTNSGTAAGTGNAGAENVTDNNTSIPAGKQTAADNSEKASNTSSRSNSRTAITAGTVRTDSLTTGNIPKPAAAIDSATKKINAHKLMVKKDTVDIIW